MATQSSIVSRYHETTSIRIRGVPGYTRVLVTGSGVVRPVLEWLLSPKYVDLSPAWQTKACRAIGLLLDYKEARSLRDLRLNPAWTTAPASGLLNDFARALLNGTVAPDGTDPLGLYWRRQPWSIVKDTVRKITQFCDFTSEAYDIPHINPPDSPTWAEALVMDRAAIMKSRTSIYKHLAESRAPASPTALRTPRTPKVALYAPPAFPRWRFLELLMDGFGLGRGAMTGVAIRDLMLAVLFRHGGARPSEGLNLFLDDVILGDGPDSVEVRLVHPWLGQTAFVDPASGDIVRVTREEYLLRAWGLTPRPRWPGKARVGWKDPLLDHQKPLYYAVVQWFPAVWGRVFRELYCAYVARVRPRGLKHPFLAVALKDTEGVRGEPLRLSAFADSLARACKVIGLAVHKAAGTTPHGLRHAYGQDLTDACVDMLVIQRCLHHKSPLSQLAYTRPTPERIDRVLSEAARRLWEEESSPASTSRRSLSEAEDLLERNRRALRSLLPPWESLPNWEKAPWIG